MKKVFFILVFLLIPLLNAQTELGQVAQIDLIVFENLAQADFAAFALSDVPAGHTRIFSIIITPLGQIVKIKGLFEWQRELSGEFETFHSFMTSSFSSRPITNLDIGRGEITIDNSSTDRNIAEEIFRRGMPTGNYRITLWLLDEAGRELSNDTELISFTNPSQTITITSPEPYSSHGVGTIILQWNSVIGASSYEVLANIRKNKDQSLEDALTQGTPIIDNADVGNLTVANLRNYFSREPLPGQEIVVQVAAVVPGPAGGQKLKSNIINFFIEDSNSPENEAARMQLVLTFSKLFGSGGGAFLEMLRNGEIDLSTLEISDDSGKRMTLAELEILFDYLQANPEALINIQFNER